MNQPTGRTDMTRRSSQDQPPPSHLQQQVTYPRLITPAAMRPTPPSNRSANFIPATTIPTNPSQPPSATPAISHGLNRPSLSQPFSTHRVMPTITPTSRPQSITTGVMGQTPSMSMSGSSRMTPAASVAQIQHQPPTQPPAVATSQVRMTQPFVATAENTQPGAMTPQLAQSVPTNKVTPMSKSDAVVAAVRSITLPATLNAIAPSSMATPLANLFTPVRTVSRPIQPPLTAGSITIDDNQQQTQLETVAPFRSPENTATALVPAFPTSSASSIASSSSLASANASAAKENRPILLVHTRIRESAQFREFLGLLSMDFTLKDSINIPSDFMRVEAPSAKIFIVMEDDLLLVCDRREYAQRLQALTNLSDREHLYIICVRLDTQPPDGSEELDRHSCNAEKMLSENQLLTRVTWFCKNSWSESCQFLKQFHQWKANKEDYRKVVERNKAESIRATPASLVQFLDAIPDVGLSQADKHSLIQSFGSGANILSATVPSITKHTTLSEEQARMIIQLVHERQVPMPYVPRQLQLSASQQPQPNPSSVKNQNEMKEGKDEEMPQRPVE